MFARIREILEDDDGFVCVLIDEVESLTAARKAAVSGSEPSDAVRVVNALLTQLDQLKRYRNALVLTTSNITGAIDDAFLDRADIKQYIGPPTPGARYQILASCLYEFRRVGCASPPDLPCDEMGSKQVTQAWPDLLRRLLTDFEPLLDVPALQKMLPTRPPTFEQVAALPEDESISSAAPKNSMALYALAAELLTKDRRSKLRGMRRKGIRSQNEVSDHVAMDCHDLSCFNRVLDFGA